MKNRYRLFQRGRIYYCHDGKTGKQESLGTATKSEAQRQLNARNEAASNPQLNLALAKAYLAAIHPTMVTRTWADVMEALESHGRDSTQERCRREMESAPYNLIRHKKLFETTADDLRAVLAAGGSATNNYLRRLHNLGLGMSWLVGPILPPKQWPKIEAKSKRAISAAEHQKIIAAETNTERRRYYELLWELGSSQTDTAKLTAANIDWKARTVTYHRQKLKQTSTPARLVIGPGLERVLRELPAQGPLFPNLAGVDASARASEFSRRCRTVGIKGVSLHSYRYAWAERAKEAGYPERWAQAALGHSSRAVHQAYARGADFPCPSLEEFNAKIIALPLPPTGTADNGGTGSQREFPTAGK